MYIQVCLIKLLHLCVVLKLVLVIKKSNELMHIKIIYLVKMSLETEIVFDIRFWLRFILFGCCCQDEIKLSRNATSTKFCGTSAR